MQSKTGERVQGVSLNALLGQHFWPPPFLVDFFDMWVSWVGGPGSCARNARVGGDGVSGVVDSCLVVVGYACPDLYGK